MNKVIICILIIFTFFPVFADTKLRTGSLNGIAELKQIPVFLNWSGTVYGKRGDLYNFLDKAKRSKDWEEESLFYFLREVNQRVGEYGLKLVSGKYEPDVSLYFEIITGHISTEGKIKGEILLKRRGSESAVAVISFESDEEDDDETPFAVVEILKMNGTQMGGAVYGYLGLKQVFSDLAEYLCDLVYHS